MASSSVSASKKKTGRPATGVGVPVQVRLNPDDLASLDTFHALLKDEQLSRPEVIRKLLRHVLSEAEQSSARAELVKALTRREDAK